MRNSKTLPFFVIMEAIIAIGLLFHGNYFGATGWGFLMLTNMDTLIQNKQNGNNAGDKKSN